MYGNQCNPSKFRREIWKMAVARDSLGRRRRRCKRRANPYSIYRKDEYLARYRLSKSVVKQIVKKFKPYSSVKGKKNAGGLSHRNRFSLALRYFATGGLYSLCGDTQHVSKALVCRAIRDVSNYFYSHSKEYIRWPKTFGEKVAKATQFYLHKEQHTPQVIGCVDGTHIPILRPKRNESCFVNRSNYHSINTTMYCDFDMRIINVDARFPGSVNDAYAFRCSPVGDQCKLGDAKGPDATPMGSFILLADSGYALQRNVFTPYKTTNTPQQVAFNTWHKKNRVRVEQTIGILKQRFRCLDSASGYLYHNPQRAAKIIVTCCCLHNIAMNHGLKVIEHENDPWVPRRPRLPQPRQRTQRETSDLVKRVRDEYANHHF